MRLDFHMFCYQYTSEGLSKITKNVLAVSIVLSSANVKEINDNTLRVIVQKTYDSATPEVRKSIYEQLSEVLKRDKLFIPSQYLGHRFQLAAAKSNGRLLLESGNATKAMFLVTTDDGESSTVYPVLRSWISSWLTQIDPTASIEVYGLDNVDEARNRIKFGVRIASDSHKIDAQTQCKKALDALYNSPLPPVIILGYVFLKQNKEDVQAAHPSVMNGIRPGRLSPEPVAHPVLMGGIRPGRLSPVFVEPPNIRT
jgi:hypothetical protein